MTVKKEKQLSESKGGKPSLYTKYHSSLNVVW